MTTAPAKKPVTKKEETPDVTSAQGAKLTAVNIAMQQIDKQYGTGSIMRLGESLGRGPRIPVVSSGSLSLNIALGVGGYPRGRIVEIYGPEASGKTTLCLDAISEVQKHGGIAAFVNVSCSRS